MPTGEAQVTVESTVPDEFAALVGSIVFVRGDARYRRLDVTQTLARFNAPRFVVARERGRLVGACVLDLRDLMLDGRPLRGLYRGLLCVADAHRGRGIGRSIVTAAFDAADALAADAGEPVLSYGCVDRHNVASSALLTSLGAIRLGSLATVLRYRQWPRARMTLSGPDHQTAAHRAVASGSRLLADRTCIDAERISWRTGGSLFSCAAVPSALRFDTLGQLADALVRWTVTPFPVARRRFNPDRFRYVSLRDMRAVDAREEGADDRHRPVPGAVLDTLLARHRCHYAVLTGDPSRPDAGQLGVAGTSPSLDVLGRWHGAGADAPGIDALAVYPVDL